MVFLCPSSRCREGRGEVYVWCFYVPAVDVEREGERFMCGVFLMSQQYEVYLRDGSDQTVVHTATLR